MVFPWCKVRDDIETMKDSLRCDDLLLWVFDQGYINATKLSVFFRMFPELQCSNQTLQRSLSGSPSGASKTWATGPL